METVFYSMQNFPSKSPIVLNFYGSPGSGKTTLSSRLFALLKKEYPHLRVEFVPEAIKSVIYENQSRYSGRNGNGIISEWDQFQSFLTLCRDLAYKLRHNDLLVVECPPPLAAYYIEAFSARSGLGYAMCRHFYSRFFSGAKHYWIFTFLSNVEETSFPSGRIHSIENAISIDMDFRKVFSSKVPRIFGFLKGKKSGISKTVDPMDRTFVGNRYCQVVKEISDEDLLGILRKFDRTGKLLGLGS